MIYRFNLAYEWTQSHGYFAIMRDFMIFECDKEQHTITLEELDEFLRSGEIEITEQEIQDNGKGNALSKGLVLAQTTWFILPCSARRIICPLPSWSS